MAKAQKATQDSPQETPAEPIAGELMTVPVYDEEALRSIVRFDDAAALAVEAHGQILVASQELGDGFSLLEDKDRLVGIPLLLMEWNYYPGDFGSTFVAIRVVARNPDGSAAKYIVNDGSSGICDTLRKYQDNTGRTGGLYAPKGLRVSAYQYCEECGTAAPKVGDEEHKNAGKHKRAATYYIDTAA